MFVCRTCDICSHFSSEAPVCQVIFCQAMARTAWATEKDPRPSWTTRTQTWHARMQGNHESWLPMLGHIFAKWCRFQFQKICVCIIYHTGSYWYKATYSAFFLDESATFCLPWLRAENAMKGARTPRSQTVASQLFHEIHLQIRVVAVVVLPSFWLNIWCSPFTFVSGCSRIFTKEMTCLKTESHFRILRSPIQVDTDSSQIWIDL